MWFSLVESAFTLHDVTDEAILYHIVLYNLDSTYTEQVAEVITPIPAATPYTVLKNAIIKRFTGSRESEIRKLVSQQAIGDRTPSEFLRYLRSLAKTEVPDSFLRALWESCLPSYIQAVLATQPATKALDDVANVVDKVHESCLTHIVAAVTKPIPENATASDLAARFDRMQEEYRRNSEEQRLVIQELSVQVAAFSVNPRHVRHRSQTPGRYRARSQSRGRGNPNHCFYHQSFGAKARKCKQPCTFQQENPTGSQQ
jgi:hypothetical protein